MAEFRTKKSDIVPLNLELDIDETRALMDYFNIANNAPEGCQPDTYGILNNVWHEGWHVIDETVSRKELDIYFHEGKEKSNG